MKTATVELFCQTPACEKELSESFHVPDPPTEDGQVDRLGRTIRCPWCETVYEIVLHASRSGYTASAPLLGAASVQLDVHDTLEIDWNDYDPPYEPITVFREARADLDQVWELLSTATWPHEAFHRMVFVQHFSILEAFLADILIQLCYDDKQALLNLVSEVDELSKTRIGLKEILLSPTVVHATVRDYLRELQFHNFGKIDMLFRKALGHSILPEGREEKEWLFKIVAIRHDCVHRNGVDRDGTPHIDFARLVPRVASAFLRMATAVDDAVSARSRQRVAEEEKAIALDDDFPF